MEIMWHFSNRVTCHSCSNIFSCTAMGGRPELGVFFVTMGLGVVAISSNPICISIVLRRCDVTKFSSATENVILS